MYADFTDEFRPFRKEYRRASGPCALTATVKPITGIAEAIHGSEAIRLLPFRSEGHVNVAELRVRSAVCTMQNGWTTD